MSSKFPFLICVTLFELTEAIVATGADELDGSSSAYAVIAPCGSTSEENTIANAIALQNARLIIMPFIVLFFISSTSLYFFLCCIFIGIFCSGIPDSSSFFKYRRIVPNEALQKRCKMPEKGFFRMHGNAKKLRIATFATEVFCFPLNIKL